MDRTLTRLVPSRGPRPGLLETIAGLVALRRERRRLAELDAYRLEDIGLTRAEALHESARSVWNAPEHWLR